MKAVKGEKLSIYKRGNFYRDYIYVDDVVSALLFLQEKGIQNDLYLIGYGKPVLFKDIISYILNLTGKKSNVTEIKRPKFHKVVGTENFVANTSKINSLGWNPRIDYKEGIRRIVEKYKKL